MTAGPERLQEIEARYDPELQHRNLRRWAAFIVATLLVLLTAFHYGVAGFGLVRELVLRSVHLALVLSAIFLAFPAWRRGRRRGPSWLRPGGVPLFDWIAAGAVALAVLYLPWLPTAEVARRAGNPQTLDVVMGSIAILLILEATRRSIGWTLPTIALLFILYALYGPYAPGVLVHPGQSWSGLVNHLYLTDQGIYGIAVGVVAKYVFLFVVFGVLATRIGLGQLFIDLASIAAGRFSGGPAKVSIFSSALLGMISGSSIANTVTTGVHTIPAMKRVGYPAHFAGAVEATASTGGQITPPIMGAAAFIMVEFLEIPYRQILLAAIAPAALHYLGVLSMVHFEAKRLGLRGLRREELPRLGTVLRRRWMTLLPLVLLVYLIIAGRTPDNAAFWSITACLLVGFFNPVERLTLTDLSKVVQEGARYALAVGAAAASVGIVVGVVTLTGMGFRLSFMVTQSAAELGSFIAAFVPFELLTTADITLFLTLIFTAVACIIMGAGIPTTATYIILVSIAAPALALLQVPQVVTHFFVFYYGVLADITPPVALAAYAAAGIAGANPFKTGNTAFRLAAAKALVPMVFAYAPAMLIIVPGFTWEAFLLTVSTAVVGILLLSGALVGHLLAPLALWERWLLAAAALCFVAPNLEAAFAGALLSLPTAVLQVRAKALRKRDA